jgi:hypothetical protein
MQWRLQVHHREPATTIKIGILVDCGLRRLTISYWKYIFTQMKLANVIRNAQAVGCIVAMAIVPLDGLLFFGCECSASLNRCVHGPHLMLLLPELVHLFRNLSILGRRTMYCARLFNCQRHQWSRSRFKTHKTKSTACHMIGRSLLTANEFTGLVASNKESGLCF